jgi:translation elongation factor EF-Tu-like GTPase
MFRKILDEAGDNVGLILRGIDKADVVVWLLSSQDLLSHMLTSKQRFIS